MTGVSLRPLASDDLPFMADLIGDRAAVGVHNWGGPVDRDVVLERLTAGLAENGLCSAGAGRLLVALDDVSIGSVSWRPVSWGPSPESACPSIGIALLPAFRGRGFGTDAQRLLVRFLYGQFPFQRIQADTAVDNPAERKSLERAGFVCEGLIGAAEFRGGRYHDHLLYAILRRDVGDLEAM